MKRTAPYAALAASVVVTALASQLVSVKRDNGMLHAAVREGLADFVRGRPLPPLPVATPPDSDELWDGELSEQCGGDAGLAIFFVRSDCPLCQDLMPIWRQWATTASGKSIVVHIGKPAPSSPFMHHDFRVSATDVASYLHLRRVPAIVRTNAECRIASAAAGSAAAKAILEEVER